IEGRAPSRRRSPGPWGERAGGETAKGIQERLRSGDRLVTLRGLVADLLRISDKTISGSTHFHLFHSAWLRRKKKLAKLRGGRVHGCINLALLGRLGRALPFRACSVAH